MERGFFPIFLDVRDKKVLFVGGGKIASRRIMVMSDFACKIEVLSPSVTEDIMDLAGKSRITWVQGTFTDAALDGADIVLACTNSEELNHEIWRKCRDRHIMVNNCSNHDECDFYFPGVVTKDEVTVAVNAGGKAHRKAADVRRGIAQLLENGALDNV